MCPIQLAVNLKGLQFKVSLKLYATKEDYDKAMQGKGGSVDIRELRRHIQDYINKKQNKYSTNCPIRQEKRFRGYSKAKQTYYLAKELTSLCYLTNISPSSRKRIV